MAGLDVLTASPGDLASYGLALYVDGGKEATELLDSMDEDAVATEPAADYYEQIDPFGDHPEAVEALRAARAAETRAMEVPEGMTGLDAPSGVISG